jgi:hypothetical protein
LSTTGSHTATAQHAPTTHPSAPAVTGRPCDLVTVPARHGLEAVDILRLRTGVGPVLHVRSDDTLGFLVPRGTADGWDLPGSACAPADRDLLCGGGEPPLTGARWLVPPEGPKLTDPHRLLAALGEAAHTIAAADLL